MNYNDGLSISLNMATVSTCEHLKEAMNSTDTTEDVIYSLLSIQLRIKDNNWSHLTRRWLKRFYHQICVRQVHFQPSGSDTKQAQKCKSISH